MQGATWWFSSWPRSSMTHPHGPCLARHSNVLFVLKDFQMTSLYQAGRGSSVVHIGSIPGL